MVVRTFTHVSRLPEKPREKTPSEKALEAARREIGKIRKARDSKELARTLKRLKLRLDAIFAPHTVLLISDEEERIIGPVPEGPRKPLMQSVVEIMGVKKDALNSTRIALVYLQTTEPDTEYMVTNRHMMSDEYSVREPEKLLKLLRRAIEEATAQIEGRLNAAKGLLAVIA